jgi:hypothetical protein
MMCIEIEVCKFGSRGYVFYTLLEHISVYYCSIFFIYCWSSYLCTSTHCWSTFLCIVRALWHTLLEQLYIHFYKILYIVGTQHYALFGLVTSSKLYFFSIFTVAWRPGGAVGGARWPEKSPPAGSAHIIGGDATPASCTRRPPRSSVIQQRCCFYTRCCCSSMRRADPAAKHAPCGKRIRARGGGCLLVFQVTCVLLCKSQFQTNFYSFFILTIPL